MLKILLETRLPLTELAQRENISVSTAWRWTMRGVKGVRLETYSAGGRKCTSEEAYLRFLEATTRAANGGSPGLHSRTTRRQDRDVGDSEKFLDSENC